MRKQMKGQISLFDYMSEDDNKIDDIVDHVVTEDTNTDLDFGDSGVISLYQECTDCWCSPADIMQRARPSPVTLRGRRSLARPVISVSDKRKRKSVRSVLMRTDVNCGPKKKESYRNK